jgi:hypothetical protein
MLSEKDLDQLSKRGITPAELNQQVDFFKSGFPWMNLEKSASIGNGIFQFSAEQLQEFIDRFDQQKTSLSILKMVPASGAATRMFKSLFEFLSTGEENKECTKFFDELDHFAFFPELKKLIEGKDDSADILQKLLGSEGMDYGQKPKGLLSFHAYPEGARTPLEEHIVEAAAYASNGQKARLHFTVSPEHRSGFEQLVNKLVPKWESQTGIQFEITFSEQKPATDTIAVNPDNSLFRESDGSLLFRPAGHGALLENLNDLKADIIFIKNIDNVVPDALKQPTIAYKKALGGLLLWILEGIDHLDRQLLENPSESTIKEALQEMATYVGFVPPVSFNSLSQAEKVAKIREVLARPTRVCGVVKNTGEPGGGPFWCQDSKGNFTLQLVESAQIDMKNEDQKAKFHQASHFNPVDLVCATRGLNLLNFRDMNTGFITDKTKDGKELKAMELPGLWNGAMSDWNTLFVEVPLETFNPVKTVTDLIRPAHQNG